MAKIGVSSYLKGNYGNKPACGARKNKANSKPIYWRSASWWGKPPPYLLRPTRLQEFVYGINRKQTPYLFGTAFEHGRAAFGQNFFIETPAIVVEIGRSILYYMA